jgi:enoyl-CoA hydratase/carnithine racemase
VSIGQVTAFEVITLARKSPMEAVVRMALMGNAERISADRARQLGIVSEVVPETDADGAAADADPNAGLRARARELAEAIAHNSPAAMAATKRALWGALEMGLTDACRAGAQELIGMWGHPDQEEGPAAWAEKREPNWA